MFNKFFDYLGVPAFRYLQNSYSEYTLMDTAGRKVLTWFDRYVSSYKLQVKTKTDGVILYEGSSKNDQNRIEYSWLEVRLINFVNKQLWGII